MAEEKRQPAGFASPVSLKERLDYNRDFKLDWHDPDEAHDGYQLKWVGKSYARLEAGTAPDTVIIPDERHNAAADNADSENIFLTGDNLQALKHLQNCYKSSVKMIYIDPPYNTGSDGFVYQDKFEFTDPQLKAMLGLSDDEVKRLHLINGRSSHSAWLSFMYPRLKLVRELLRDDGVIFISIDDNEQANLKLLCDEIFGEANFVGNFIWKKKNVVQNDARFASTDHEYLLCYTKNAVALQFHLMPRTAEQEAVYANPDSDPRGRWTSVALQAKSGSATYEITFPNGVCWKPVNGTYPRLSKESLMTAYNEGRLWFGANGKNVPRLKKYLSEVKDGIIPNTVWLNETVGSTQIAKEILKKLLGNNIFDTPKPVAYIKRMLLLASDKNSIILDFFAGSGTTAQAVMELNRQDGGKRQWILCQLDEPTAAGSEAGRAGYQTIDQIARERIKRAAEKIGDTRGGEGRSPDREAKNLGFRHYKIQQPQARTLDKITEFDPEANRLLPDDMAAEFADPAAGASGEAVILATWALADGFKFTDTMRAIDIEGYTAHYAGGSRLYLIAQGWGAEQTKALLNLIGNNALNVNALIVYGYSFAFESLRELENAASQSFDKPVQLIKRY